ncbi:MAG TPA: 3-phosphoglycerate dehydrogenase, partial [Spirochaetota bacterium]|nr:3-phosphoglycerate dehydrogenase [Spirochaetota bacterium]
GVIPIPHLGASTPESEDNCAIMAVRQLVDFLENGNIVNSANFPDCAMPRSANRRIVIANRNVPNIIGQFARILAQRTINIGNMLNKSKGDVAYNIIDIDGDIDAAVIGALGAIDGVVMVRAL